MRRFLTLVGCIRGQATLTLERRRLSIVEPGLHQGFVPGPDGASVGDVSIGMETVPGEYSVSVEVHRSEDYSDCNGVDCSASGGWSRRAESGAVPERAANIDRRTVETLRERDHASVQ